MVLENIAKNIISYYKLSEAAGEDRNDFLRGNDLVEIGGTVVQGASLVTNADSNSASFDGTGEYLQDADPAGLNTGSGPFSIAFWAQVNNLGANQGAVSKFVPTGNQRQFVVFFFGGGADTWRFGVSSNGSDDFSVNDDDVITSTGETHFVVVWYDDVANTVNINVDDTGTQSAAGPTAVHQGTAGLDIGRADLGVDAILTGLIDEVAIWSRILTATEITELYNSGNGRNLNDFFYTLDTPRFGGYLQGASSMDASGLFGGFLQGSDVPIPTTQFGGYLASQATSEAKSSGLFGGFMQAEAPTINSGSFGGFIESFESVPTSNFGGLLFAKATNESRNVGSFGGFIQGVDFQEFSGVFGGFMQAQPTTSTTPAHFGGVASGARTQSDNFGGWMFGAPGADDFVELHARTLVKVRSEDVVDQGLNLDSQVTLFQRANADFTGKLGIESTNNSQFHGKLEITRDSIIPTTFANVTKITTSGVTEVVVEASGLIGESNSFFVNAQVDFGEPYDMEFGVEGQVLRGGVAFPTVSGSISGFEFDQLNPGTTIGTSGFSKVIRASHVYDHPGRYIITTKFMDNLGIVHMQGFECDLLTAGSIASNSGIPVKGIDYPAIEISGIPREGAVPGSLRIDYQMRASGTGYAVLESEVEKLNNTTNASNDFINWSFGNGFIGTTKRPFAYYDAPGLYIGTLRYQYNHPSGIQTGTTPSGQPIYGTRSIWLSDSLLLGFST